MNREYGTSYRTEKISLVQKIVTIIAIIGIALGAGYIVAHITAWIIRIII